MREIKFRGMNFCGNWVYGDLRHDRMCMPDGKLQEYISVCGEPVSPKSFGQYTGMKDAKGKEIYEGDILLYRLPENMIALNNSDKSVVFYGHGMFLVSHGKIEFSVNKVLGVHGDDAVVIGNVHDNPELLEVEA